MAPQFKGQALLTNRAINATMQLLKAFDEFRDVLNEYSRLGYDVTQFDIETLQEHGIEMRSFYTEPPTTNTLISAVGAFQELDNKLTGRDTNPSNPTFANENALRRLLEFLNK